MLIASGILLSCCSGQNEPLPDDEEFARVAGCYAHPIFGDLEIRKAAISLNGDVIFEDITYRFDGKTSDRVIVVSTREFLVETDGILKLTEYPRQTGHTHSNFAYVVDDMQGKAIRMVTFKPDFRASRLIKMQRVTCSKI